MIILPEDFIIQVNLHTILTDGGLRKTAGEIQNQNSFYYLLKLVKERSDSTGSRELIADIASFYFFKIIQNHIFYDGNKRTASFCAYTFVMLNGYRLSESITNEIIIEFALSVANRKYSQKDVLKWFLRNIV